jgi:hypothetical protein
LHGFSNTRYGPPSGFGYPLDGFLPSRPRRLCFTPAALLGFALRSLPLPRGNRAFWPGRTHIPFLPRVQPPSNGRPAPQAAVSGLLPSQESLAAGTGLASRPLAAPLSFTLPGYVGGGLCRDSARLPLTRFRYRPKPTTRRPRVSPTLALPRPDLRGKPQKADQGDPLRVLAPARS